MVRLSDYSSGPLPDEEPDPTTARGMGLILLRIGQDLDERKDTEPREALLAAADGLQEISFTDFSLAARRLALLDDADVSTGANEMAGAVIHLMMQFALAMRQAGQGGNAEIDPSLAAHRPNWAKHL